MNGVIARRVRQTVLHCGRGLLQAAVAPVGIPLFAASVVSIVCLPIGVGVLTAPVTLLGIRALANTHRCWALKWSGVPVTAPYRPRPKEITNGVIGRMQPCKWLLTDLATWRDLLWSIVHVPVSIFLGVLPAALLAGGIVGILVSPWIWLLSHGHPVYWLISVPLGIVCLPIGIMASPSILRGHALFTQSLLAPTRRTMEARVRELTESRSEVVDASAAELRRIEHDLHDGPQARLVSLGLTIGLAERMVKQDPDAAMALLTEVRLSSGQALTQLRDLVRGIRPPVLAERGLGDAVRALALTLPVPVDVYVDVPGRAAPPVESAVYFAIAEMLANMVKHSSASSAWVQLQYDSGRLFAVVGDNGVGGAVVRSKGGLRGVERRLAVFDGAITVMSTPGGPTVITMELPCELSSVKI
jgi:signal transduction histidine kinase